MESSILLQSVKSMIHKSPLLLSVINYVQQKQVIQAKTLRDIKSVRQLETKQVFWGWCYSCTVQNVQRRGAKTRA